LQKKIEYAKNGYFNNYNILYNNQNLLKIGKDFDKSIKSIKVIEKKYCNSCQIRITNKLNKKMDFKLLIKNLEIMGDQDFKTLLKYLKLNNIINQLFNLEFYNLDLGRVPEFQNRLLHPETPYVDIYLYPLDFKYCYNDTIIIEKLLIHCINEEATLPDSITLNNNLIVETQFLQLKKEGIIRDLPSFIENYKKNIKEKEKEYNNNIKIKLY
jgi:hypothetical protein